MMEDAKEILSEYLAGKGFNATKQRYIILEQFIALDRQLDANELFIVLHARRQKVTHATIYSAMKLFVESGIAKEIRLGDGVTRYERATEKRFHEVPRTLIQHHVCTHAEFAKLGHRATSMRPHRKEGFNVKFRECLYVVSNPAREAFAST